MPDGPRLEFPQCRWRPLPLEATPLADVLAGSSPQQFVVGYRHPDGNRRWLDMNVGPLAARYRRPPAAAVLSIIDITARHEAEDSVRKLSQAVEQSPNVVLITDRHARIQYVNDAFERITGYTRDEVIGQNPSLWRSPETPPETYRKCGPRCMRDSPGAVSSSIATRTASVASTSCTSLPYASRMAGSAISWPSRRTSPSASASARTRSSSPPSGRTGAGPHGGTRNGARRCGGRQSCQILLPRQHEHEIRTPMNAIIGLTHLLEREVADPRQLDHLHKVSASARHLLAIINDILDISKIEADKVVLEQRDFRCAMS